MGAQALPGVTVLVYVFGGLVVGEFSDRELSKLKVFSGFCSFGGVEFDCFGEVFFHHVLIVGASADDSEHVVGVGIGVGNTCQGVFSFGVVACQELSESGVV